MPRIKVTVITVCFNAAETIEKTIRSVCSQTDADIEYIVVDGASTDHTLDIVSRYAANISKVVSEKDDGIFDAMNKGAQLATGDVVYFLNADDYFVDDEVIRDISRAFQEDDSRTIVYGNVVLVGEPAGIDNVPAKAFGNRSITEFLHNSFCHQAVFARRSLFSQVGLFDRRYKFAADYEWMIRAFKKDRKGFFFLDRKMAFYFYLGRSRQYAEVTRKEAASMQFRHFLSLEYLWYYFRYVLVRSAKKRLLNEPF